MSEHKDPADDAEDIPSDFFDDFNKEEFMEGLSVIDSWDEEAGKPRGSRLNAEALDSVNDLRELIGEARDDDRSARNHRRDSRDRRRSGSRKLEDYIKPGSRRDPSKTKEAIKRDKEVKVKEYLAKKIEGSDDLRPPGTELDDYLDEAKLMERKHPTEERSANHRSPDRVRRETPPRQHRDSPTRAKRRRHSRSRSPLRARRSPLRRSPRRSPLRPGFDRHFQRRDFRDRGDIRDRGDFRDRLDIRDRRDRGDIRDRLDRFRNAYGYGSRSPRRSSPRWERSPPSRSPRRDHYRRSRSRSPAAHDSFLYPQNDMPGPAYHPEAYLPHPDLFPGPQMEFPTGVPPGYPYQPDSYAGGFPPQPYDYPPQLPLPMEVIPPPLPVPQPVPAPLMVPGPVLAPDPSMASIPMPPSSIPMPSAIPAPDKISPVPTNIIKKETKTPFDALAQLVAEGKLSKEDYLKLAPNKSKSARLLDASNTSVETKARVDVLNRCNTAITKLSRVLVPNHLVINLTMLGPEPKAITPKFCSPLKRQATTEFFYTTPSANAAAAHNKQLIDAVISAVGLTNVVARPKKKAPKNMKDAAVQTTKPYCDVCEVREATRYYDTSTSIDPDHFSTSTHTQVLEQDLLSSKAMFAPTGSMGEGATMSIAHLTPAQLVSQLAARAKTLKQTEPQQPANQFGRRPGYDYDRDYDNRGDYDRGGQQYHNNYNNYNRY